MAGKYSVYGQRVDNVIKKDLNTIIKVILSKLTPRSIILFGGFGKGEGFVEVGKKIIPLNDYDLYIILDKRVSETFLEDLGAECSKSIGAGGLDFVEHPKESYDKRKFFHVDIRQINYNKLSKLLPTQRTFELKYASQILWGENVLAKIPDVTVSVSDAIRILFNKCDHLLLSSDKSAEIKKIYISKAYTDLCSALLIFKKDFSGFYRERATLIKKHDFPKPLINKIEYYTKYRLSPAKYSIQDVDKEFEEAKQWVEYGLKLILKNVLDTKESSWESLARLMYYKLPYIYFKDYLPAKKLFPAQYLLTLKYVLRCWKSNKLIIKPLLSWRDVGIKVAIPLILYLFNKKALAEKYLKKITNQTKPLKETILELYGLYYLQKII